MVEFDGMNFKGIGILGGRGRRNGLEGVVVNRENIYNF